jgi:hypothetical protein
MKRTMLTFGFSARDAKDLCTKISFVQVVTALYSTEESKLRRIWKRTEKSWKDSWIGDLNYSVFMIC